MAINNNMLGFAIVGGAVVILLGYMAYLQVDIKTYPDVEIAAAGGLGNDPGFGDHNYSTPENSLCDVINLPHRYPTVSGGNITSLIHHGLSPLRQSKGMDQRWITRPPGEVMW
jgi:hypothetical protein